MSDADKARATDTRIIQDILKKQTGKEVPIAEIEAHFDKFSRKVGFMDRTPTPDEATKVVMATAVAAGLVTAPFDHRRSLPAT